MGGWVGGWTDLQFLVIEEDVAAAGEVETGENLGKGGFTRP